MKNLKYFIPLFGFIKALLDMSSLLEKDSYIQYVVTTAILLVAGISSLIIKFT